MTVRHPVVGQNLADEQATVTLLRLALAAEQRDPMLTAAAHQALNGPLEP
jgi:hypothetical protein